MYRVVDENNFLYPCLSRISGRDSRGGFLLKCCSEIFLDESRVFPRLPKMRKQEKVYSETRSGRFRFIFSSIKFVYAKIISAVA